MSDQHYNLVVIGGGSGGLACAKEAADLGQKVAVLDYVEPSPKGTSWGLGGTCVNVGCIPKKLMHHAALLGHAVQDAKAYGWDVKKSNMNWKTLAQGVQNHVKSLNFGHRVQLKQKNVTYLNRRARIKDKNTIVAQALQSDPEATAEVLTTDYIVLATGTRPSYPENVPGLKEYAISSDDIFWMTTPPGKTLCIGASYVSLETAGFLKGLGFDVTVLVRSRPLRMFDQQMAELVTKEMEESGIKFYHGYVPISVEKKSNGKLKVDWRNQDRTDTKSDVFDTVFVATGRRAVAGELGLEDVGVELSENGYVVGNYKGAAERSSVENIFAIGDILEGRQQLTPVAIKAGKLLAHRLFGGSSIQMDYVNVPSTVYTPLEYSFVGLSEEEAIEKFGQDNIDVLHAFYKPLEFVVPGRACSNCYMKVIAQRSSKQEVVGIHYLGPNAGEVMQGFAVAIRCGPTVDLLRSTIGIHPTCAEEVVKLHITKASGLDPTVTGC